MSLPKIYEPHAYESDVYQAWEKSEAFLPKNRGDHRAFSLVMPPPNANGNLHIGHALTNAIQDVMVRFERMRGKASLYLPGADHAGFETWVVYEKQLTAQGKTRFDFSRSELYSQVWNFVEQNKEDMLAQLRELGASCDWSRFTYTLDEKVVATAYETFNKMWKDELIYRGERIVNYCTNHGTSFSDIEVVYKSDKSKLWYIDYPLSDGSGSIQVATTRPETMLGDTAVAVHPKDERYKKLVGKMVRLPLCDREIPIIEDEAIDPEFGTGAVKVTPAHDPNDYDIASRHNLEFVRIIDFEGKITDLAPKRFQGQSVEEAREHVVTALKKEGALAKEEDYEHSVGHCYKCDSVIEPLLKDQWFVKMAPLAKKAIEAIKNKDISFFPKSKGSQLLRYLENIRDWNISRQIAWGIPIPAYQNADDPNDWIFNSDVGQETLEIDGKTYKRDPDVFDTWFSSGQWPFVTLGYPKSSDYKHFYPLSVMETGGEILFQWVGRMIMLGLYITKNVPFKDVYIHGYVLDEHGAKMSKSKGNVIAPKEIIKEYGSDALRMGLIAGRSAGLNQGFSTAKIVGARNFCNKLWNAARFVESQCPEGYKLSKPHPKTMVDYWMLEQLRVKAQTITQKLENYQFTEAYETIYHLLWDDFADWYIEVSKHQLNKDVLAFGLINILKLAHPFAPFVTESIWRTLAWEKDMLIINGWPQLKYSYEKESKDFSRIQDVVSEIRYLRSQLHLTENNLYYKDSPFIKANADLIVALTGLLGCHEVSSGHGLHLTRANVDAWIDVEENAMRDYLIKLLEERDAHMEELKILETRLENKSYLKSAPHHIVEETRTKLAEKKNLIERFKDEVDFIEISLKRYL
ncbi:valine--tRNA ligase [Candidatus Saccharibacteria bacterium CPR2]|nr:valine--tRNA ligase [Candidatus Saccharibacteria bacterium CPR2]